jgi:hypothetical protein
MDFGNWGPQRWAIHLTQLLNAANPPDRYRFDLARLAVEFTRTVFPQDPILRVEETDLDGFEGALLPSESGKRWGILCARGRSPGRRRFTLAHEFGHYLLHRKRFPEGFRCTEASVDARDGVEIEREANDFASTLLMPLDDFRARVPATAVPGFDELSDCASRYEVSLSAAILRWLRYTDRRAMIVVSRDGYINWSWSSNAALKTGRFFRTTRGPVAVPPASAVASGIFDETARNGIVQPPGIWFDEKATELTIRSEKYDLNYTILHFEPGAPRFSAREDDGVQDTFERFSVGPRPR